MITKKPTNRNKKNKAITPVLNFHHAVKLALKAGRIDAENLRNKKRWQSMERAWETIYGTFPGFPKNLTQTITIYREISVNAPERIATEIFQGTRKPGQYWAFDEAGSGTYMQGGSEATVTSNVRMEGEIPLKDIDPVETLVQNFMNPDEYEAGLLTLDNLKLTKVEWLEQVEYERGGEPHDVWHEVTANRSRKRKNKSKFAPGDMKDGQGVKIEDIHEDYSASEGIFYHGSSVLPSIVKREGLEARTEDFWNMKRRGVFLTTDEDVAGKYGEYVYKIELDDQQIIYRDDTEESSWYYKGDIPAKNVSLFKTNRIKN